MFFYGIDMTYIIYVLPAIILSMIAQARVSSTFSKYNKIASGRGITGAQLARRILDSHGLNHVVVEHVSGNLSDHYDPKSRILRLSDSVFSSNSVAALGVAAHECGHAIQHSQSYAPLTARSAVYPVVRFSSAISMPLILIGIVVSMQPLVNFGIILFAAVVLFQLITLPVEFNASRRALTILSDSQYLYDYEIDGAKKVLSAAAMTYVASALTSIMQLLRLIIIANNRRD